MNRRRALLTASSALLVPKVWAQPVPIGGPAGFQTLGPGPLWAGVPGNPPSLDLNLLTATLDASVTWTRANATATDGLYTDAAGSGFNSFAANAPRINATSGLLIENARTNFLLNSGTPVTQTTASLGNSQYSLWVIGSGTATSSAVTAVGSGFGVASAGSPNTFTITTPGTVLITVSGSLTRFQLENSATAYPTSYVPTVAAAVARAIDSGTLPTAAWFNANEGTLIVDFMQRQISAATNDIPSLYTATTDNLNIRITNTTVACLAFAANINIGGPTASGAMAANVPQKIAITYVAATKVLSICLNGGPVVFATASNTLPTFNQIKFGTLRVIPQDGTTRRIRYYPRALQVPELRAVTAL